MKHLVIIAVIFCLIQASVIFSIQIKDILPNLIILILIYTALFHGEVAMFFGFFMGLFQDCYSASTLGCNTLIYTVTGYLLGKGTNYLYKDNILFQALIIFTVSVIVSFFLLLFEGDLGLLIFFRYTLPSSLYTTIIGAPIFLILRKIDLSADRQERD